MTLKFLEYDGDCPFVFDKAVNKLFRMDGKSRSNWVEITDSDSRAKVKITSSIISRKEAEELAEELAAER